MTDSHGGMAGRMHGRKGHILWLTTGWFKYEHFTFYIGVKYPGIALYDRLSNEESIISKTYQIPVNEPFRSKIRLLVFVDSYVFNH